MNHRKACLTAALLTAVMMTASPTVQAAESPEVSIIDITEDTLPEPSGDYLPTKIWTEEEDGQEAEQKRSWFKKLFRR